MGDSDSESDAHPELQALLRVPAAAQPEGQLRHLVQWAQQGQERVKLVSLATILSMFQE